MTDATSPTQPASVPDPYGATRKLSDATGDLAQRGKKTWRRFVWGCGCGCLSFLLLLLVGLLAFYVWASATKEPVTSEMVWHPGLASMVSIHLDPNDAGVAESLQKLAARIDADEPGALPQGLRDVMAQLGRKSTREILDALVPIEIGIAHTDPPIEQAEPDVFFVSFARYANLFAWLLRQMQEKSLDPTRSSFQHLEVDVMPGKGDGLLHWVAITKHTAMFAQEVEEIKGLVARVRGGTPELGELGVYRAKIESRPDFYGVMDNASGWLADARRWGSDSGEFLRHLKRAHGIAWSADLITADVAHVTLWARMPDARAASDWADLLNRHKETILRDLKADQGWDYSGEVHAEGEWVRARLEVDGFEKDLQDWFLKHAR